MQLTTRGLALLLAGAVPLGLASLWTPFLALATVYLLAVVGLLCADALTSPRREHFQLERRCDSRLSLAANNPVQLRLYNASKRPVSASLRDEFPASFQTDAWQLVGMAPPLGELTLIYHLKPLRRGDYTFGDLNLRYRCRLGLIVRQERYRAAQPVKVYPNLLEVRRYDLLARRGQLVEMGLRSARVLGRGTEFERLRDYELDDDYRDRKSVV